MMSAIMIRRHVLAAVSALGVATLGLAAPALATDRPSVVTSFSILADITDRIGGEHVDVTMLVGPDGDAHVYQPTPADARAVAAADLIVVNGLHFEGWIERLLDSAGYDGPVVVASDGIDAIEYDDDDHDDHHDGHDHGHDDHDHDHGDGHGHHEHHHGPVDPHAWHDPRNAAIYADNIADGLAAIDPSNAAEFEANAAAYRDELMALDAEIRALFDSLPEDRRRVLTSHDSFGYFGRAYGIEFLSPVGVSTESEASARDIAGMIDQIRADDVSAVFVENVSDRRLMDQMAADTGAVVGGVLFSDALSAADGPAPTLLEMVRMNAETIAGAIEGSGAIVQAE